MALTDDQRAAIRANNLAAFARGVRAHFDFPPATWRVEKRADRLWYITHNGFEYGGIRSFTTKRDAEAHLANSDNQDARQWHANTDWYLGYSRDSRLRALTDEERQAVNEIIGAVAA